MEEKSKRAIPIARPSIGKEELKAVERMFSSGWLGMGSEVFEFEKALKEYLGALFVICVNTGTSALHIALDALGLDAQDEVIVPSLTFAGSVQAIIAAGARPVFCEVSEDTLNMDIDDVKRKISKNTKAIMPVHYGGMACDMDSLLRLRDKFGLRIIEDAAHAFGSSYKGKKIGAFGDITCFSFDPIKNITCGEGGAVVVRDGGLAEEIMKRRILGIDKDTWHRYRNERSWFYEVVCKGYRYHMSNINAAIGLVQLNKLGGFIKRKREIVKIYDGELKKLAAIELLFRDYEETAPFNYIVKVKNNLRDSLLDFLNKNGIGAGVHYIPNHIQPAFKDFKTDLPVTEKVWKEIISLPLYFDMTNEDVGMVIAKIKEFF